MTYMTAKELEERRRLEAEREAEEARRRAEALANRPGVSLTLKSVSMPTQHTG